MGLISFLFRKNNSDTIEGNFVKYSPSTAKVNPGIIAREYDRMFDEMRERKEEFQASLENEYITIQADFRYILNNIDDERTYHQDYDDMRIGRVKEILRTKAGDNIHFDSRGTAVIKLKKRGDTRDGDVFELLINNKELERIRAHNIKVKANLAEISISLEKLRSEKYIFHEKYMYRNSK